MLKGKIIGLIIPFYNEEKNIGKVIETIPDFVDLIVLVNDGSTDKSVYKLKKSIPSKIDTYQVSEIKKIHALSSKSDSKNYVLINHLKKSGKGAGISTGYAFCKQNKLDCIATMDGDGQMDPLELSSLCLPIIENKADYCKGNRLQHPEAFKIIPKVRLFGIIILSYITKVCSGYWHIHDAQTGYTAISSKTLKKINTDNLYKEYGYPNDMLVRLNIVNASVLDVPITPIYPKNGGSKMNVLRVIPLISFLLIKLFFFRIIKKHL